MFDFFFLTWQKSSFPPSLYSSSVTWSSCLAPEKAVTSSSKQRAKAKEQQADAVANEDTSAAPNSRGETFRRRIWRNAHVIFLLNQLPFSKHLSPLTWTRFHVCRRRRAQMTRLQQARRSHTDRSSLSGWSDVRCLNRFFFSAAREY